MSLVSSLSFLFLFLPCPSLSFPLLSLLSLFSLSLGDETKWPTRVDVSLYPNTINQSIAYLEYLLISKWKSGPCLVNLTTGNKILWKKRRQSNFSNLPQYFQYTVISNSKGLSEILRDIRTSTYQFCRIEEKIIRTTTFNKFICNWALEVRDFVKILWKRGEIARSNFSSFPQNFSPVVRFSCLGRDKIFTSR